jgi:hypothetical protein
MVRFKKKNIIFCVYDCWPLCLGQIDRYFIETTKKVTTSGTTFPFAGMTSVFNEAP